MYSLSADDCFKFSFYFKEIDEELNKLQPEIISLLLQGDNLVLEIIDDKERVSKIKQLTDNLRVSFTFCIKFIATFFFQIIFALVVGKMFYF